MFSRELIVPLALGVALTLPFAAHAANEVLPTEVAADKALAVPPADAPQGWALKLTVGATGSYGHSSNVVGAIDGATVQLGVLVNGSANLTSGQSSWENALKLNETQTRTPQLASFIKSADELALQSTYLYHLPNLDWFGPFARAAMTTQIFSSYDVRPADVTIVRTFRDGTTKAKAIPLGDHIQLAKPFEPLLLKEGVGAFANPYTDKLVAVKTKLGLGMQHVMVGDGFTLADDKATPELEIKQLEKSTQGGGEAEVELGGTWSENISWGAKANVFYPFYTSVETKLTGINLMTTDLSAKLSVKLAKWASLDYVLSAKRVPLILEKWQVQNNVLFTAGFDII
jgi:hypothetical protein